MPGCDVKHQTHSLDGSSRNTRDRDAKSWGSVIKECHRRLRKRFGIEFTEMENSFHFSSVSSPYLESSHKFSNTSFSIIMISRVLIEMQYKKQKKRECSSTTYVILQLIDISCSESDKNFKLLKWDFPFLWCWRGGGSVVDVWKNRSWESWVCTTSVLRIFIFFSFFSSQSVNDTASPCFSARWCDMICVKGYQTLTLYGEMR